MVSVITMKMAVPNIHDVIGVLCTKRELFDYPSLPVHFSPQTKGIVASLQLHRLIRISYDVLANYLVFFYQIIPVQLEIH